jgi:TonB family protein
MRRKTYILSLFFFIPFILTSQNYFKDNCQYPSFPNGGESAFWQYLKNNVRYPEAAKAAGTEGVVKIAFLIDEKGSVSNIFVEEGVSPEINAEAVRLIKNMPRWVPGQMGNNTLRASYTIPIIFKIERGESIGMGSKR